MPKLSNGVVTCPHCGRIWRGRAVRGGLAHSGITERQRQALAWFANLVPGFWTGAEWRLHELLERVRPTSELGVQLRRKQLLQRVQAMTQRGVLVYRGAGTYALAGRWCRITGTMPATADEVQPATAAASASPGPQADDAL